MHERVAIVWVLVLLLGLLLGLVIIVTALGVSRHLRRLRPPRPPARKEHPLEEDGDSNQPGSWRRPGSGGDRSSD